jgi:hypothetical protein
MTNRTSHRNTSPAVAEAWDEFHASQQAEADARWAAKFPRYAAANGYTA